MKPRKPVSSTSSTSPDKFEVRRNTTAVLNHFPAPSIYCGRVGSGQYYYYFSENGVIFVSLAFSVSFFMKKRGAGCITITLKWPTRQRMSFIWQHRFTFTCIGADRTNGGEKFCILSQSIPWGFSGPSLPQTVQRVLLTKANVKGHIWTNDAGGFGFVYSRGARFTEPAQLSDRGQGGRRSEWAMARGRKFNCV